MSDFIEPQETSSKRQSPDIQTIGMEEKELILLNDLDDASFLKKDGPRILESPPHNLSPK